MDKNKTHSESVKGALYVASGAALWGIIGLFTRQLSAQGLESMEITAVRLAGAGLLMAVFYLVRDRSAFCISWRDIWMFLGTGILSFVFFNWCYFSCIEISSLSVAAVLLYTAPCFVTVMSAILFREKLTRAKVLALIVTTFGCALVTGALSSGGITPRVVLLGLGSGFGYALYSIFGRFALRKYSPGQVALWTNLCGGAAGLLLVDLPSVGGKMFRLEALAPALLLIACSTIMPLLLYTKGLAYLEAGRASILATLEPVVAAVVSVAVFKEPLTLAQIIGMLLVLGAIAVAACEGRLPGSSHKKRI